MQIQKLLNSNKMSKVNKSKLEKGKKPKSIKDEDKENPLLVRKWDGIEGDKIDQKIGPTGNIIEEPKFLDTSMALDFCNFTGFTLMQNISTHPKLNLVENRPKLTIATNTACGWKNFQGDVNDLKKKISDLDAELLALKVRMSKPKEPDEKNLEIERALMNVNYETQNVSTLLKQLRKVKELVFHGDQRIRAPPVYAVPPPVYRPPKPKPPPPPEPEPPPPEPVVVRYKVRKVKYPGWVDDVDVVQVSSPEIEKFIYKSATDQKWSGAISLGPPRKIS